MNAMLKAKVKNLKLKRKGSVFIALMSCILSFSFFRWSHHQDALRAKSAMLGALRNEYLIANSYALSKAIADLENLGIIKCVVLSEERQYSRVFYDTSNGRSCIKAGALLGLFENKADMVALNGLTYLLQFQLPLRWQVIFIEFLAYVLIISTFVVYRRNVRLEDLQRDMADALVAQSRQVSHDIRSPLSALNMALSSLDGLSEERRLLIRNAVQRINDIANGLLLRSKQAGEIERYASTSQKPASSIDSKEEVLLAALLDALLSEKRAQYRTQSAVEIRADLSQGYGLFAKVNATEFARSVSNLINNSVEAISGQGIVTIAIRSAESHVSIVVSDNGKGIPPEILAQIGEKGISHGKEGSSSGSGLGLFHARETVERAGGKLLVQSKVGEGTQISIKLPLAQSPRWFVDQIKLPSGSTIISVDDDQTIHQIWAGRLSADGANDFNVLHRSFSSLDNFERWLGANREAAAVYFIDYEFIGEALNGLDVIGRNDIANQAILVTSRYEEPLVRARADALGVRILPKNLAPFIPFEYENRGLKAN